MVIRAQKFVSGAKPREVNYEATHIVKTHVPYANKCIIEVYPGAHRISVPEDADVVYVMNDSGKTIDTIRGGE